MTSPFITDALKEQTRRLLGCRSDEGVFPGRLSSSALATAVGVRALMSVDARAYRAEIEQGLRWLMATQREDGSWGDTPRSAGNISTTLLCYSVIPQHDPYQECRERAEAAIQAVAGSLSGEALKKAIMVRYGNDRTFSAPILSLAAVSGVLGPEETCWALVPQLPFELAALPRGFFRFLKLDVVSYALPALIAIGLLRHVMLPGGFLPQRLLRSGLTSRLLDHLIAMQPENGGFLEAVPLTGFVTMSLAEAGYASHPVVTRGVRFIRESIRDDGSMPIDTNLATWLTSQSVKALPADALSNQDRQHLLQWYLGQQFTCTHPFTGAAPGGWGWTALPGSVPDADDTAGALLAIHALTEPGHVPESVTNGITWLINLQNADGGIPTFCRGWGRLPFDRSCPDITGHSLEAFSAWYPHLDEHLQSRLRRVSERCLSYLSNAQESDGSWLPLWFGNEHHPESANPCYGTSMVLDSLNRLHPDLGRDKADDMISSARNWLVENRNDDGSWGAKKGLPGSREETALAVAGLAPLESETDGLLPSVQWLIDNCDLPPAPIGLYFASLWYYEALYPEIFTLRALRAMAKAVGDGR